MIKTKVFRNIFAFLLCFFLAGPAAAQPVAKKLVGTVTGVLQNDHRIQVFISDRENAPNTVLVSEATPIKKQIDVADIRAGEFAGVICEEEEGKRIALSTSVGVKEKVVLDKEELLKFAPQPEVPVAPEVPQAPEMPPLPGGAQGEAGAATPGQQQGGVDKKKEATGFSAEEAAKAKEKGKDKKNPLDDILSEEGPLSKAAGGPPPSFVSGKILSIDLKKDPPTMILQDAQGKELPIIMGPQPQIVNRYLDVSGLGKGDQVEVVLEEKDKDLLAKSILIARSKKTVPEEV